jgi:hypothetical protein
VADGDVSASDVQAILHEDALLEVQDYTVPERVEENLNVRANWRLTTEVDRNGDTLVIDMAGRHRHGVTGRYATPVEPQVEEPQVDLRCRCESCVAYRSTFLTAVVLQDIPSTDNMPFLTEDIAF